MWLPCFFKHFDCFFEPKFLFITQIAHQKKTGSINSMSTMNTYNVSLLLRILAKSFNKIFKIGHKIFWGHFLSLTHQFVVLNIGREILRFIVLVCICKIDNVSQIKAKICLVMLHVILNSHSIF